ncbi:L,D-transpeptidase family protein [Paracoccus sulfuroxidans]|uniref:L,D-transpeptidase-like protein n=1 Tax=Paracoccus sulfuroxidans TaxID=384678 RepID=A0A562NQI1_9RHOB|nr:L,D-transpeptidase family protein [Paracoccus sulfuroxidans]TWI34445.1 L,D-transpeptidase-like protein [Paracoccus sulfuroxidans]
MKRLASLFSALSIAFLIWGGYVYLRAGLEPVPAPEMPDHYIPQTSVAPELTSPVQRILIEKQARRMTVFQQEGPAKIYKIALGFSPDGNKSRQGDGRTPEGVFRVDRLNPQSRFHLSLGIDYPQPQHRRAARAGGFDPGGDIMIHGQPNTIPDGFRVKGDWTEGCIAIDDDEIEEIFALTRIGTEVEIRP